MPDPERLAALTDELARFAARFAALEQRAGECQALTFLGYLAEAAGDLDGADRSFAASEDIAREIGWEWWESGATVHRAVIARLQGDDATARERATSALALSVRAADRMGMVFAAAELAATATRMRDVERAGRLWGAIEAEEERAPVGQWPDERNAYAVLVEPPDDERAAFERARERGRLLTIAQAAGVDAGQTVP